MSNQDLMVIGMTIVVLVIAAFHYIPRFKRWLASRKDNRNNSSPPASFTEETNDGDDKK